MARAKWTVRYGNTKTFLEHAVFAGFGPRFSLHKTKALVFNDRRAAQAIIESFPPVAKANSKPYKLDL